MKVALFVVVVFGCSFLQAQNVGGQSTGPAPTAPITGAQTTGGFPPQTSPQVGQGLPVGPGFPGDPANQRNTVNPGRTMGNPNSIGCNGAFGPSAMDNNGMPCPPPEPIPQPMTE